jgi:hypothetical protein
MAFDAGKAWHGWKCLFRADRYGALKQLMLLAFGVVPGSGSEMPALQVVVP